MYSPKTTSLFHCDVNFGWVGKESYGGGGGGTLGSGAQGGDTSATYIWKI